MHSHATHYTREMRSFDSAHIVEANSKPRGN